MLEQRFSSKALRAQKATNMTNLKFVIVNDLNFRRMDNTLILPLCICWSYNSVDYMLVFFKYTHAIRGYVDGASVSKIIINNAQEEKKYRCTIKNNTKSKSEKFLAKGITSISIKT